MVSSTASAPSLPGDSLCRQSSAIRTGCANKRPSGSEEGVASNRDPYSDLIIPVLGALAYPSRAANVRAGTIRKLSVRGVQIQPKPASDSTIPCQCFHYVAGWVGMAQLAKSGYEPEGRESESLRAHHQ